MARNGKKLFAATAAISASALVGLGLAVAPAQADDVEIEGSAPEVAITAQPITIAPTSGTSSQFYAYTVTVSDDDTLANLDHVSLCMFAAETDGTPIGDDSCTNLNPQTTVLSKWTQSNNTFTITGTSDAGVPQTNDTRWRLGNDGDVSSAVSSNSMPQDSYSNYTGSNTSMTMSFTVRVSDVTREGKWGAKAVAVDQNALSDNATVEAAKLSAVNWYGAVTSPRTASDFGTMSSGATNTLDNQNSGTLLFNGDTDVQAAVTDFETADEEHTITNTSNGSPSPGEFVYKASPNATYGDGTGAVQLSDTASTIFNASDGTGEAGVSPETSVRLILGTNIWPSEYSNTVTVTVANH